MKPPLKHKSDKENITVRGQERNSDGATASPAAVAANGNTGDTGKASAPKVMTFSKVHEGLTDCRCTEAAETAEDLENYFARRVFSADPEETDFLSWQEQGKILNSNNCRKICQHRGVSVNLVTDMDEAELKNKWAEVCKFRRTLPKFYCKFKFKALAGRIWHTPSPSAGESHCDFFKCDHFTIGFIEVAEIVDLETLCSV